MEKFIPNREDAYKLLTEYVQDSYLINHALMVESTMRHFADLYEEDVEKWGVIGLIHDLDFEKYPEQHCEMTEKILIENNWPEEYIRGVLSHGWGLATDVEPIHPMEKVLYTIDELTGLIYATAIMRPSNSLYDLKVKSVKKKWKQASFAAAIKREVIAAGAELMGMELDKVIGETIEGMKGASQQIGLNGELNN